MIKIAYDSAKRVRTLRERHLDFDDAAEIFEGTTFTYEDVRKDYGETRFVTAGLFRGRMVLLVWTPRGDARHVISMRKANEREKARFGESLAAD